MDIPDSQNIDETTRQLHTGLAAIFFFFQIDTCYARLKFQINTAFRELSRYHHGILAPVRSAHAANFSIFPVSAGAGLFNSPFPCWRGSAMVSTSRFRPAT